MLFWYLGLCGSSRMHRPISSLDPLSSCVLARAIHGRPHAGRPSHLQLHPCTGSQQGKAQQYRARPGWKDAAAEGAVSDSTPEAFQIGGGGNLPSPGSPGPHRQPWHSCGHGWALHLQFSGVPHQPREHNLSGGSPHALTLLECGLVGVDYYHARVLHVDMLMSGGRAPWLSCLGELRMQTSTLWP